LHTTQNTAPQPKASRAILVTLLIFGCGDLGFFSGIFAGAVGKLPLYAATATGAGAFLLTLGVGFPIMLFIVKSDGS
jgi:hypothetical protein